MAYTAFIAVVRITGGSPINLQTCVSSFAQCARCRSSCRSPARELNMVRPAILVQMRIDEFRAVVGVDAAERERQGRAPTGRAVPGPTWLPMTAPCSTQVVWMSVRIQRVQEIPLGAMATHEVHFREARLGDVPASSVFTGMWCVPGFVRPYHRRRNRALVRREQAIDLAGADGAHLGGHRRNSRRTGPRRPRRQEGLQRRRDRARVPCRPQRPPPPRHSAWAAPAAGAARPRRRRPR